MSKDTEFLTGIFAIILIIAIIIFWPIMVIWALNTLFGLKIGITFVNWFAVIVIAAGFRSTYSKSKN